jgi:hypothetical protein
VATSRNSGPWLAGQSFHWTFWCEYSADSSLVYSHEGYPEEAAGGIPRNDSYMSAILSRASKMSSRARSHISSETPHRKPTDIRACDNCRKAKVRCGGERATEYCQGPRISRYRLKRRETPCTKSSNPPGLLDAAGDVPSLPAKKRERRPDRVPGIAGTIDRVKTSSHAAGACRKAGRSGCRLALLTSS